MDAYLTVSERLNDLRKEQKLTYKELSEKTGVSASALHKYESGKHTDISPYNLIKIAQFYDVSLDYLMGLTDIKKPYKNSIGDLGISEKLLKLLRANKINNHLLSQIILHKGFRQFLLDAEIYIKKLTAPRVLPFNLSLAFARDIVLKRHKNQEEDIYLRSLVIGQIDEGKLVKEAIHKDLDIILDDIRIRDKDTTIIDETIDKLKAHILKLYDNLLKAASEKRQGSYDQLTAIICQSLGIPIEKLTEDELKTFTSILKKSDTLKTLTSQRGKTT